MCHKYMAVLFSPVADIELLQPSPFVFLYFHVQQSTHLKHEQALRQKDQKEIKHSAQLLPV